MHRTFQFLAAFWAPTMLLTLIFSTMIESTRTYIEHSTIGGHLLTWAVVLLPAVIFYVLANKNAPQSSSH